MVARRRFVVEPGGKIRRSAFSDARDLSRRKILWAIALALTACFLFGANRFFAPPVQESGPTAASEYWRAIQSVLEDLSLQSGSWQRRGDVLDVRLPENVPMQLVHARLVRGLRKAGAEVLLAKEEMVPPTLEIVFGDGGHAIGRILVRERESAGGRRIRVALIVDDLGYEISDELRRLLSLPIRFTVAVIPGLKRTAEAAELAHASAKEVIVHMPMEPEEGEVEDNGFAIYVSLPADEIAARVAAALDNVPHAKGLNNHEGSKATSDLATMEAVMRALRQRRDCYFVDSRTSMESRAFAAARRAGVPALRNTGFLDAKDEEEWIRRKFWELLGKSGPDGSVVMLAHARKTTLRVLLELVPKVADGDVEFVYASELAR